MVLHDGCVLMARNDRDPYHYSVGGGVHHGESAAEAVVREVYEETGVRMAVDRLAFVHENFFTDPVALPGRSCHELTLYFLMRHDAAAPLRPVGGTTAGGVREWCEWVPLDAYGRDRPAHPAFLATELHRLDDLPCHVVTREVPGA